jgi:hypothetical protein
MRKLTDFLKWLTEPLYWPLERLAMFLGWKFCATDTILTISMITNKALMVLENELTFTGQVNRTYDDQFGVEGAKIGDTVNVRRPPRFIGTSGPNLNVEDYNQTSIPVTVGDTTKYGDQFHVDVAFTTKDLRLSLPAFSDNVIVPAVAAVANKVDFVGLTMAKNSTANIVGVPGTPPTSLLTYLTAGAFLTAEAAPKGPGRSVVIEQFTGATIVDALKGLFMPEGKISEQFKAGRMGRDSAGMNWFVDQNVNNQTFGAWTTTASTLTADTTAIGIATGWAATSTITLTNGAGLTLRQGDIISIANVFPVNPQNRQIYGTKTRPFVVQTTVTAGAGTVSVTVAPAIITGGQFQNVSITTTSATATVTPLSIGTSAVGVQSPQNILFHKNAYTCVMVDLPLPGGVARAARASSKESGMSIRVVTQYTINNDQEPTRFDVLFGWAPLYQELGCRIAA